VGEWYDRRITGVALRAVRMVNRSDLPSLFRRGSKLASSSCESAVMSAMFATVSLSSESARRAGEKTRMFGGDGCLFGPPTSQTARPHCP
jgi:hypothetical protein